ncbi:OprD family outer membrane porin [Maribacter sp. X9]|uniref:OprD family outer membrane porin n=1 Tax=Maribacter sp. X9 TaxID=3402159 RepID=UPI003AF3D11D
MWKLLLFLVCLPIFLKAQDSVGLENKGKLSGQWRTFYMGTLNKDDLKDYNALAIGGKLKYQYELLKNLELGAALYNSTNLGIQNLQVADATTGRVSRYEEGLFDRQHLSNDAVFLLGELFVDYQWAAHQLILGRMKINTPLINPQDGRMIPTLVEGLWYKHITTGQNVFQFGMLNRIAPRSTGEFFGIGESIGTYNVGRNTYGKPAQYKENTQSDYILLANADIKLTPTLRISIWNQLVENVYNSFYLKSKFKITDALQLEGEWLHQNKVGNGGNALDSLRYFNQNTSDVLGMKWGYQFSNAKASLSYNRILANGQFISPREWGREDLFSFQKRERSEGSGDNHAIVFNYETLIAMIKNQANINTNVSVGRHWKPELTNDVLNKYAVPDYTHINVDLLFNFKRLKQLKPELLITTKLAHGDFPDNPNFYYNKVDTWHVSAVVNYNF